VSIRVLVVDDQDLVRAGFVKLLETESDLKVVAEAGDGLEGIEAAARTRPDVVLMDIRMPNLDGIEATRRMTRLAHPPRVLILTTYDLDEYVFEALKAGASGFLLKDAPAEQFLAGVRAVAAGDALLAPTVTRRLIEEFANRPSPPPGGPVELARGLTNAEIAADLVLGESTVKTHVGNVLMKLGLRDRVQAVVVAYETGLIRPGG
jgi:DNA-binding NarL/FixJ family response regulator